MSTVLTMSANQIGLSFSNDSELSLPERPCFIKEILLIPHGQMSVLLEGVHGTQVLGGKSARNFLPRLLPFLDGHRTIDEIAEGMPSVPKNAIVNVISLLYSRGLLEDGASDTKADSSQNSAVFNAAESFYGRYNDVTRVNKNRSETLARLGEKTLSIYCSPSLKPIFETCFKEQGINTINLLDSPESLKQVPDLFIACFTEEESEETMEQWMRAAWDNGCNALYARLGSSNVEIGPYFVPQKSASYDCFRVRRAVQPSDKQGAGYYQPAFWAAAVAHRAHLILSRVGRTNMYNRCHVHEIENGEQYYHEVAIVRQPGSVSCGLGGIEAKPITRQIWLQHSIVNDLPTKSLLSLRDYQQHYAPSNIKSLSEMPEPYWGAEKLSLPNLERFYDAPSWFSEDTKARPLNLQTVTNILGYSLGYIQDQEGKPRRVAPSAGGLCSSEAFLVVDEVDGLKQGIYHYFAKEHCLYRIGSYSKELLAGAVGLEKNDLPPLLLVNVGHLTKLRQKYSDFAFRFINLDTGVTQVYLYELFEQAQLPFQQLHDTRDDALTNILSVPTTGGRNAITAVYAIGKADRSAEMDPSHVNRAMDSLMEGAMLGNSQSLRLAEKYDVTRQTASSSMQNTAGDFTTLLIERRSVREFKHQNVPLEAAAFLAEHATIENQFIVDKGGLPFNVHINLALCDMQSDTYKVYRWDQATKQFIQRKDNVQKLDIEQGMLQKNLANAPAIFFISGPLHDVVEQFAHRGYRDLYQRASAVCVKALLLAHSVGLAGCLWGGMSEDGIGALLDIDRYTDCPLFGVSLGYDNDRT